MNLDQALDLLAPRLSQLFLLVLQMLVILVVFFFQRLKKRLEAWLDTRVTSEQKALLMILGRQAYALAEALYRECSGEEKAAKAFEYFCEQLKKVHVEVSDDEIRAAIQAAWEEYEGAPKRAGAHAVEEGS